MGQMKPFGVMLGLLGNVMIALSISKLIQTGSCGGEFAPACPDELTPYFIMLPAGIIISVAAIFLGGGALIFLGVFLSVGIGSLIAGFSSEESETQTFGKIFGAAFAGIPLLIIVLMLFAGRAGASKIKRAQSLVATGARGVGTVSHVRDTGMTINDNPRVEITMAVQPEDGSAPFSLEKTVTVSRVAIPRAGDRFPVWYDRADPGNWAYGTDMDPSQTPPEIQALFAKAAAAGGAAAVSPTPAPAADGPADELMKLNELRLKGVLTDEEFEAAKARVLGTAPPPPATP
jgi:putative oligomerization/nucleic acid binding protein